MTKKEMLDDLRISDILKWAVRLQQLHVKKAPNVLLAGEVSRLLVSAAKYASTFDAQILQIANGSRSFDGAAADTPMLTHSALALGREKAAGEAALESAVVIGRIDHNHAKIKDRLEEIYPSKTHQEALAWNGKK